MKNYVLIIILIIVISIIFLCGCFENGNNGSNGGGEEGTETTAATAVIINYKCADPPISLEFRADHPFIFIIQHKDSGNILFMGRVNDPRK